MPNGRKKKKKKYLIIKGKKEIEKIDIKKKIENKYILFIK